MKYIVFLKINREKEKKERKKGNALGITAGVYNTNYIYHFARQVHHSTGHISGKLDSIDGGEMHHVFRLDIDVSIISTFLEVT